LTSVFEGVGGPVGVLAGVFDGVLTLDAPITGFFAGAGDLAGVAGFFAGVPAAGFFGAAGEAFLDTSLSTMLIFCMESIRLEVSEVS
jgi:hypothetical protein